MLRANLAWCWYYNDHPCLSDWSIFSCNYFNADAHVNTSILLHAVMILRSIFSVLKGSITDCSSYLVINIIVFYSWKIKNWLLYEDNIY